MDALRIKELAFISGYIRMSTNHNTIIVNGIILIIHNYCSPLLLKSIDAMPLSSYMYQHDDPDLDKFKIWNDAYVRKIKKYPDNYKLVVVGPGSMGKTCLLIRYTTKAFPWDYVPTVFDNHSTNIMVDKTPITLSLWDTEAGEDYHSLRTLSYPQTDVIMICMSVYDTPLDRSWNKHRIDKSGMWNNLAVHTMAFCQEAQLYCPLAPRVLIGTKIDLRQNEENLCYTKDEMESFAKIWGCHAYFECSALKDHNVKGAFESTVRLAMRNREELLNQNKSKKGCIVL